MFLSVLRSWICSVTGDVGGIQS